MDRVLNMAQSFCSFSFNYTHSQSLRRETALSPAARLLGIDALTCGCNNSTLTAVKIDFKGQTLPNQHTFSQEHSPSHTWSQANRCLHLHTHTRCTLVRGICQAFICMLSHFPFDYNSSSCHRWRELSKQLSQLLLWLRSAVGLKGATKRGSF